MSEAAAWDALCALCSPDQLAGGADAVAASAPSGHWLTAISNLFVRYVIPNDPPAGKYYSMSIH